MIIFSVELVLFSSNWWQQHLRNTTSIKCYYYDSKQQDLPACFGHRPGTSFLSHLWQVFFLLSFHCFNMQSTASSSGALRYSLKFHITGMTYLPLGLYSFISRKAFTTTSWASCPASSFRACSFSSSSRNISFSCPSTTITLKGCQSGSVISCSHFVNRRVLTPLQNHSSLLSFCMQQENILHQGRPFF